MSKHRLGRFGIWSPFWSIAIGGADPAQLRAAQDTAAELEDLGFGGLWMGRSPEVRWADPLLAATTRIQVATSVTRIWTSTASEVAETFAGLRRDYGGRFLLGLGVSHSELNQAYAHPYAAMVRFLDDLDAAAEPVPSGDRILAALGPKMLKLSAERTVGANPYLVTRAQIAEERVALGPDAILAPEFKAILDADRERGLATARSYLATYLQMTNYRSSFVRGGFGDDDFTGGGSERLIDAVFAIGAPEVVAERLDDLLVAGADHVAVQVVTGRDDAPKAEWRALAAALTF
jgi:probable F420-dependent oxidoreductase